MPHLTQDMFVLFRRLHGVLLKHDWLKKNYMHLLRLRGEEAQIGRTFFFQPFLRQGDILWSIISLGA